MRNEKEQFTQNFLKQKQAKIIWNIYHQKYRIFQRT